MKEAKILIYDLEVSPRLGWAYDMWETNILKIERPCHLMSLSWHWLGDEKNGKYVIHNIKQNDTVRFLADSTDDLDIVKQLHSLLDEAEIVIAHNANRFDNKVSNTMFMRHGMLPPSPFQTIDTLVVARSKFKFPRNSLGELGDFLEIGHKSEVTHSELWYDCIIGNDKKSWKLMKEYNNRDVELLTDVYLKLRPYINNHPNLSTVLQRPDVCPRCGGTHLINRGWRYSSVCKYRRFRCSDCGAWTRERTQDKEEVVKPTYVNA